MIEAYSIGIDVAANAPIPFNDIALKKGCTVELISPSTIQFNKCGIYMLTCSGNASVATNVQLYKNGIAQPQAQSVDTSVGFTTLVQVPENNSCCPCSTPTTCQLINDTAATFETIDLVITKVV